MTDQKISINDLPDLLTVREVAEVLRAFSRLSNAGAKEANSRHPYQLLR